MLQTAAASRIRLGCAPPAHHPPKPLPTATLQERGYSAHGAYSLSKLANIVVSHALAERLRAAASPLTSNCLDPGKPNATGSRAPGSMLCAGAVGSRLLRRLWRAAAAVSGRAALPGGLRVRWGHCDQCRNDSVAGTVNTKMLLAGWGPIGMRVQVRPVSQPASADFPCAWAARLSSVHHGWRAWLCTRTSQDAGDEFTIATDPALEGVSGEYFVGGRPRRAPGPGYDRGVQQRLWRVLEEQTGAVWSV